MSANMVDSHPFQRDWINDLKVYDRFANKVHQWLTLGLPFPVVLNGWLALQVFEYFQPLVTVFVLAALLAFILNYPVQFLQNAK